jgi:hypothetical protein
MLGRVPVVTSSGTGNSNGMRRRRGVIAHKNKEGMSWTSPSMSTG